MPPLSFQSNWARYSQFRNSSACLPLSSAQSYHSPYPSLVYMSILLPRRRWLASSWFLIFFSSIPLMPSNSSLPCRLPLPYGTLEQIHSSVLLITSFCYGLRGLRGRREMSLQVNRIPFSAFLNASSSQWEQKLTLPHSVCTLPLYCPSLCPV